MATQSRIKDSTVNDAIQKTKLCRHFYNESCRRGQKCTFAHALDEVRPISDQLTVANGHYYNGVDMPGPLTVLEVLKWNQKFNNFAGASPPPNWVYQMVYDAVIENLIQKLEMEIDDVLSKGRLPMWRAGLADDGQQSLWPDMPRPPNTPPPPRRNIQSRYWSANPPSESAEAEEAEEAEEADEEEEEEEEEAEEAEEAEGEADYSNEAPRKKLRRC